MENSLHYSKYSTCEVTRDKGFYLRVDQNGKGPMRFNIETEEGRAALKLWLKLNQGEK